jgi:Ca2+-binding EF-hand superfamily protein
LQSVFQIYDKDNSGHLSAFELRQALQSAGYNVNNKVLEALALRYGDHEGQIWFDDFIMCAVKLRCMIGTIVLLLTYFSTGIFS